MAVKQKRIKCARCGERETVMRPGVTEAVMGRNLARWDMAAMILRRASARLLIYLGRVTI